ncbi:hypothetical protein F511_17477 [Dorcoceras hygrometricum]|uniref:Uncharacterized protein n=1 Tax=Dorcoceras hygrometricum TaxID=472368 RepID=A0A2Z7CEF5_9LAMI|nr:hypothetical protein F511_17477 [Dorcoceras hygrometricum]
MNQLERRQPASSAKERSEPAVAIEEEEESQAGAEAMKKSAGALSVDDISSDVIIQQEAIVYQQWSEANKMKRRRVEASADGLALMTSSVMSSYSADGLKEQSQESADSAGTLCDEDQSQDTSWKHMFYTSWTTRRKQQQHPVESLFESAVAIDPVASFRVNAIQSTWISRRKNR